MKILITGGLGFVGSHLIKVFGKRHDLIIFDNKYKGKFNNFKIKHEIINDDISNIFNYTHLKDIDVVYHFAANSNLNASYKEHIKAISDASILLDFCKINKVRRFIFASSSAVYGDSNYMSEDNFVLQPKSLYGISKLAVEHLVRITEEIPQRIILRYFNIYGYGNEKGIINNILKAAVNSNEIKLNIDPIYDICRIPSRDFIHVKDVSNVNRFMGEYDKFPNQDFFEIFNVGTGKSIDIISLTKMMLEKMEKSYLPIRFIGKNSNDIIKARARIDKLERYIGGQLPQFMDIKEGLNNYC